MRSGRRSGRLTVFGLLIASATLVAADPGGAAPSAPTAREETAPGGTAPGPAARSSGSEDAASDEAPAPKKKKSKKSRSTRESSQRPRIAFSGEFALRLVYDDNIIHYSDEDLHEFETGPTPGKYSITSAGDWIVRPRIDLQAETRALTGRDLEARLRISSWRYVENGVKDNESYSLLLKHPAPRGGNIQVSFYHAPESYLRNFRDRPPFTPRSTPLVYTDFSYTSTSLGVAHWRRLSNAFDGKLEIRRSWRYYNREFMENDNWEWRFGGYLSWRLAGPVKLTGEYAYSVVDARATDTAGGSGVVPDDGDASYERDSYGLGIGLNVPRNPTRVDRIDLAGEYQVYWFTSDLPPETDRYHVGRKDEIFRFEVTWSTRAVLGPASFEGGYRRTVRDSSAPWEGGDGESIDEDKDYTDDRTWVGVAVPF